MYAGRSSVLMERAALVYRRSWILVLSGFFEPLFYLLSFGPGWPRWSAGCTARTVSR